jgi:hypothetical protein
VRHIQIYLFVFVCLHVFCNENNKMTFFGFRRHKLEVQADVSETASAITCVSEKSGSASTRALAGSILNYKQANCDQQISNEDGGSERVRFDSMIYVLDGQYSAPLDSVS